MPSIESINGISNGLAKEETNLHMQGSMKKTWYTN